MKSMSKENIKQNKAMVNLVRNYNIQMKLKKEYDNNASYLY